MNTDYKLLTKILGLQLSEHSHMLVHSDQAGFIPRRLIYNHIRLAQSLINYAEVMDVDGAIVALDQEKAYDKIRHDYLWKTLEAFNLPHPFITTVKSLYQQATTQVAINGVLSKPYKVTRGVRQGDPLSCPLFNLAIEPLACAIRNERNLGGIPIPGTDRNPLITLFADDTNLFLSKYDRFDLVQHILDTWCRASGAKFNLEKTEIIPIGTEAYRNQVTQTRKINPQDRDPFNGRTKIANDGEAVRILGAWLGNHTNNLTPWEPVLDKIRLALDRWRRVHPTLHGRKLILQAIVGGHTQFLTKAQGMPANIEKALSKIIRDFTWEEGRSPRIAMKSLYTPIEEGGLNLLDIKTRNDAIDLIWLKSYLDFSPSRPMWAKITDLILNASAPPRTSHIARLNTFLQTWDAPTKGPRATLLNDQILRMLRVARKYNVNLAAIRLAPRLQAMIPAWYHPYADNLPITTRPARCLLRSHTVSTVADLIRTSARLHDHRLIPHIPDPQCPCNDCVHDRQDGCQNPHACATEALNRTHHIAPKFNPLAAGYTHDNLSLTVSRKAANERARATNGAIRFDPSLTCKNELAECFRVFTTTTRTPAIPACRIHTQGAALRHRGITIYTDGACFNNGKQNAHSGSGVWHGPGHARNAAIKIPGHDHSNQIGELVAVIAAIESVDNFRPLTIITDSRYVIDGLTSHLPTWEDNGWIGIKNAPYFKRAAFLLKQRTATTDFQWVKGHDGIPGNEGSDSLARAGADKPDPDPLILAIPPEFDLQGAKLAALAQAKVSPPVPWQSSVGCACVTVDAIVPNYLVSVIEELDKPYVILG
jgi:ribonuclease HI